MNGVPRRAPRRFVARGIVWSCIAGVSILPTEFALGGRENRLAAARESVQALRYSVFGYTALSAVVERATGHGFDEALERHLTRPLGLDHTGLDRPERITTGRTRFYAYDSERRLGNVAYVDPSYKWAGGGMAAIRLGTARSALQVALA